MTAQASSKPKPESAGYVEAAQHLHDELHCLDLIIKRTLAKSNTSTVHSQNQLPGLVVSPEEVAAFLNRSGAVDDRETLETEIAELDRKIADLSGDIERRVAASVANGQWLPLADLQARFALSDFQRKCLVICFASEISSNYQKVFGFIHDDITQKRPTIELITRLLCTNWSDRLNAHYEFYPESPLRKLHLIEMVQELHETTRPLVSRPIKLDDRITAFLCGHQIVDPQLCDAVDVIDSQPQFEAQSLGGELQKTIQFVDAHFRTDHAQAPRVMIHVYGPRGVGKREVAATAATRLGLPLLMADLQRLKSSATDWSDALWRLAREACLQSAVVYCRNFDVLLDDAMSVARDDFLRALEDLSPLTVLSSEQSWQPRGTLRRTAFASISLTVPHETARVALWKSRLSETTAVQSVDLHDLASMFRFTPGQMDAAIESAKHLATWEHGESGNIPKSLLYQACRTQSNQRLSTLARKVEPKYQWDDIVLPHEQKQQLHEICNQAKNRSLVMGEWGFGEKLSLGKGIGALFSGPPGTGKTMAAEILAGSLGLDLYKIDLSQVVSKYIGETEKNLSKIFAEAQTSNAILFFDEADALFGKRSEVRDSHDRYANLEISYLLQQMEEYEGISLLATNLQRNLDDAFVRRLQFIVQFPFPDAQAREQLWRCTFAKQTPRHQEIDYRLLAERFSLAGGNIKSIVLNAAYLAANNGRMVGMRHLLKATKTELKKLGRIVSEEEFV